jgi:PAS domain S-box-containing protein
MSVYLVDNGYCYWGNFDSMVVKSRFSSLNGLYYLSNLNRHSRYSQRGFSLGSLSIFFWLFTFVMAFAGYLTTEYLIKHQHQKVEAAATISAKGLADIINERIGQHYLIIQAISMHPRDRNYALSTGGGYPFDLSAMSDEIDELLPDVLQFAILNSKGQAVVGSDDLAIGPACQANINHTLTINSSSPSLIDLHGLSTGKKHYDIVQKLQRSGEVAGLLLSFKLDPFKTLLASFDTSNFGFIMVDTRSQLDVMASTQSVGSSFYGQDFTEELKGKGLALVPIRGTHWSLLGLEKPGVFKHHAHQVRFITLILFLTVFGIVLWLVMYLKSAEMARKQLEEDSVQDSLFNAGPTVLFQKQPTESMPIQYVSPNIMALLGCSQQEVLHKPYNALILAKDRPNVRSSLLKAFDRQLSEVNLEYRLELQNSPDYCWVNDVTHITYDPKGRCIALQSYVNSVHAQKMAEQYANNLIESAADAIAVTNQKGVVVRVNQAFETLFGYNREEMVGRSIEVCIDKNSQKIFNEFKQKSLANRASHYSSLGVKNPLLAMTKLMKALPVEISFSSINSIEGLQIVHIIRDVSVQIEAQKQMQIAKENAEALAKARSRFVASMSHEIRTPLNGVLGMSNLLWGTPLNSKQQAFLQAIEYSGHSLLRIVNSILDFAKLDEGAVQLEVKPFNLNRLVHDSMQILQNKASDLDVMLQFENRLLGSDQFIGDAGRIQQIILNLLGNAIKFSPEGRVDISLKLADEVNDSATVSNIIIEVKDNGIGIAHENINRLFDSFTQADASTTRKYGGTGLGLAITKQLAKIMGGEVGVSSVLNKGSQFWVKLPLKAMEEIEELKFIRPKETADPTDRDNSQMSDDAEKCNPPIKKLIKQRFDEYPKTDFSSPRTAFNSFPLAVDSAESRLKGKLVLLIEDDVINQQVISEFILRLGARVDIAENGIEGLSFWRTHPHKYSLILMDCQMPMMDGFEASVLIRKEELLSGVQQPIPIVALTANALPEDRDRCFSVGMNDFISKPIDVAHFNQTLLKWTVW